MKQNQAISEAAKTHFSIHLNGYEELENQRLIELGLASMLDVVDDGLKFTDLISEDENLTLKTGFNTARKDGVALCDLVLKMPESSVNYSLTLTISYFKDLSKYVLTASKKEPNSIHPSIFEKVLNSTSNLIYFSLDREYRYIGFNRVHEQVMHKIWGVNIRAGVCMLDYITKEEDRIKAKENFDRALLGEEFKLIEEYGSEELSRQFWEDSYLPLKQGNEILGLSVFVRDITEEKERENSLADREALLSSITQGLSEGIFRYDVDLKRFEYVNAAFLNILEAQKQSDLNHLDFDKLFENPQDRKRMGEILQSVGDISNETLRLRDIEGQPFFASVNLTITQEKNRLLLTGTIADITDEVEARNQLFQSEQLLQASNTFANTLFANRSFRQGMLHGLREVVLSIDADRAYYFEFDEDENDENRYIIRDAIEWCAEGFENEVDLQTLVGLSMDEIGFKNWIQELKVNRFIQRIESQFPESERELLEAQNIKSLLVIPIFINYRFTGFIGCDNCVVEKRWKGFEIEALRTIAWATSSSIQIHRQLEELKTERNQAIELSKMKSRFLANMSHEIRTPLNGILGLTEIINEEYEGVAGLKEYTSILQKSGQRLLHTISAILNFSQIEKGDQELQIESIDLDLTLSELGQEFKINAQRKGIGYKFHPGLSGKLVRLDRAVFTQIMNNLIGNAIKFTNAGEVSVITWIDETKSTSRAYIEVQDTGIGIDHAFIPLVFESFERESGSQHKSYEGTGLGLSIVKKYIEMFGGDISVQSKKGEGSTFTFWIPIV